jgi:hypothetical protein
MIKNLFTYKALRALSLGSLIIWGSTVQAEDVFSLQGFSTAAPIPDYHVAYAQADPRFSYSALAETRLERGARTFKLALGGVPGEIGSLLSFPLRDPKTTGLFLLGAAALISVDRQTTMFWQDHVEPQFEGFKIGRIFPSLSTLPAETQLMGATIGLTYLGGLAFNNERAQTAALLSGKAIAYSVLTSQLILKPLFGRLRPYPTLSSAPANTGDYTTNPWDFGYGGGTIHLAPNTYASSMPSFHFTQYFAIARVYSGIYDNSPWPYVAAGLIASANIRNHHHWVSDMVIGSLVGIGIGNIILNGYDARKMAQDRLQVMPMISRDSIGVSLSLEF